MQYTTRAPLSIRPAIAADQRAITAIVRAARINPFGLDWQRFLVVEESGGLIAVGQVKPHRDGSRELASIAVVPEWQGQGLGAAVVRALLAREPGTLHLMCASPTVPFYQRFGFYQIGQPAMPRYFRRMASIAAALSRIARNRQMSLAVMRRDAGPA
ncbi:MAG TPA: GNAT family N-acetyltransferase [Kouleothrix sp.]|uniref:GNAT family N-acetyltransferase n=1 Tax=Kouleothrix sp. TaxID=2779161 RepID=UPI002CD500BD|nr:GNAT family N-acetyltransferase [Kouleothrix sp.]HRC75399.1 GNAT family N-acetyltransferase [Kouleothrix sp.]